MKPLTKLAPLRSRTPLSRSQMMARIRGCDTKPEVAVRIAVHALGHRFRKNVSGLPGKPDVANKSRRWAIFVHGCFWHAHDGCRLASKPKSNGEYWNPKLLRTRDRDFRNAESLRSMGFRVLLVWECEVKDGEGLNDRLKSFFSAI